MGVETDGKSEKIMFFSFMLNNSFTHTSLDLGGIYVSVLVWYVWEGVRGSVRGGVRVKGGSRGTDAVTS